MTLCDRLTQAINDRDAKMVTGISNYLFFKCGLTYREGYEIAQRLTDISLPEWDELLREGD